MVECDGPAPPPRLNRKTVVKVDWHDLRQFICVSDKPFSLLTHWQNGRSERCTMANGLCSACANSVAPRWRGFLLVLQPPSLEAFFLELSENAISQILSCFADRDSLRGSMFKLAKTKGGLRGRFCVEPVDRRVKPDTLPMPETPEQLLDFLFKAKRH